MNRKLLWGVLVIGLALMIARSVTVFFVLPDVLLVLLAGYGLFRNPFARGFSIHHRATPTSA